MAEGPQRRRVAAGVAFLSVLLVVLAVTGPDVGSLYLVFGVFAVAILSLVVGLLVLPRLFG